MANYQILFSKSKKKGRKRSYPILNIVNAIFYILKSGCSWGLLPNDLPPSGIVYYYFRKWKKSGLWKKIQNNDEKVRIKLGRDPKPSAGIVDSQSIKSTDIAGDRGYDGGKKIKGIKRHILVDVLGMIIESSVTTASTQDRTEAKSIFSKIKNSMPRLEKIWADGGYTGPFGSWVKEECGWDVEIIKPVKGKGAGFHVRPWCWIVERTFGWLNKNRRLSKNYEVLKDTSEALISIAMIKIMVSRLA